MSFSRMIHRIALVGVLLGFSGSLTAAFPERKTFQFGEFTIEASGGDEAYVEALAVQLGDYRLPAPVAQVPVKLSVDALAKRRDYFLGQIAAHLGLAQSTEKMGNTYDGTMRAWQGFAVFRATEVPQRFALWRKTEVLARMEGGETVAGFHRDSDGNLTVDFKFSYELKPDEVAQPTRIQQQLAQAWQTFIWPVKIGLTNPSEDTAASLAQLRDLSSELMKMDSQVMQRIGVYTVVHEATEMGVVTHFISSKDRRWFCDGVANYVSLKIIEADLGVTEAKAYYDLKAELTKYAPFAKRIDLANWPAAEDLEKSKYPADLNTANYAFATKVIADVCAKYGDGFLPKLFREIAKTPREKATIDTVYKAFKRLTKEDLRSYLPKPAPKG